MTTKELLLAIAEASDAGADGIALYEPTLTNATRNKNGLTTLTFKVRVRDFRPKDALNGMKAWLAVGTVSALKRLHEAEREIAHD